MTSAGEIPIESQPNTKFCLEEDVPLAESMCWKLLSSYYEQMSISAWTSNAIPMFVTTNAKFCKTYVQLVLQYILDIQDYARRTGDSNVWPIYILEIGAGHGRFTYLFIKHMLKNQSFLESLGISKTPFVYVYTDISRTNIDFCAKHPHFRKWLDAGILDLAYFDANRSDKPIHLITADRYLPKGSRVVVIANYVLDSLLIDTFKTDENANVTRGSISIYSSNKDDGVHNAGDTISRMSVTWKYSPLTMPKHGNTANVRPMFTNLNSLLEEDRERRGTEDDNHFTPTYLLKDTLLASILNRYVNMKKPMSFTLPIGTFALLSNLYTLSNGELLVLVGDKGYRDSTEFVHSVMKEGPHIAAHGSISFMVNLHALKLYFEELHGSHFSTPYKDTFQVSALVASKAQMVHLRSFFLNNLSEISPSGLICLHRNIANLAKTNQLTMEDLLHILRYSCNDATVFHNFKRHFVRLAVSPIMGMRLEDDLLIDFKEIFDNWFPLDNDEDVPEGLGHLCMKISKIEDAIYYFERSISYNPSTCLASTLVNLSTCYKAIGDLDKAVVHMQRALDVVPDFGPALELKRHLEMCRSPLKIVFLGCGSWVENEVFPLMLYDKKVEIVGFVILGEQDKVRADRLSKTFEQFPKNAKSFFSLQEFLHFPYYDACIVDMEQNNIDKVLIVLTKLGKHVLSRTPVSFAVSDAKKIVDTYMAHQNNLIGVNEDKRSVWHVVCSERLEEIFIKDNEDLLRDMGEPLCFNISYVTCSSAFHDESQTKAIYYLYIDALRGISAMRAFFNGRVVGISCEYADNVKHDSESSSENDNSNPRLCGNINMLLETPRGDRELSGTYIVTRHGCDQLHQLEIYFRKGILRLSQIGSGWKASFVMDGIESSKEITAKAKMCLGNQTAHETWITSIWDLKDELKQSQSLSRETTQSDSSTTKDEPVSKSDVPIVHESVLESLLDSTIIYGVQQSIKNKGKMSSFVYKPA